jgi:hypothetical protein
MVASGEDDLADPPSLDGHCVAGRKRLDERIASIVEEYRVNIPRIKKTRSSESLTNGFFPYKINPLIE